MKILINGSGVRIQEIELTACELKDLAYCIQQICEHGFNTEYVDYGCISLCILP
jgi:hypothetical protein